MRRFSPKSGLVRAVAMSPLALTPLLIGLLAFRGGPPERPTDPAHAHPRISDASLDDLEARVASVERGLERVDAWYAEEVAPVERVLRPFHPDEAWVRRISIALAREGRATGLDPRALASVLLVENPWLDPGAESSVGAVGLMQVMPVHAGGWGCGSADLADPETNICHGARIFAEYLRRYGDVDRALLAYNGCVRGTNTPDCYLYPSHVYSRAGRAAMRRWLDVD